VFHGKGGYDWQTVYEMPLWLRRYTFNVIKEYYDKEKEEQEKQMRGSETLTNKSKIAKPPIVEPSYTTKASKK
jgi:hypothetical protein